MGAMMSTAATCSDSTTLLCLPFAGAGASVFKDWNRYGSAVRVVPVQLPGREQRFAEPAYKTMSMAITGLGHELRAQMPVTERLVLFGHSLGALLAYELCHELAARGSLRPAALVVSGSASPWDQRVTKSGGLADDAFIAQVERLAGYAHPALQDRELRELLLPTLRADVQLHESYSRSPRPPLSVPILVVRGVEDGLVDRRASAGWSRATTARCIHRELPGGHMYLVERAQELVALIEAHLRPGAPEALL